MIRLQKSEKTLCAFCKLPHRVYKKSEVNIFDICLLLLITGIFTFVVWGEPDPRSLILFMTLAFTLQCFIRIRWRNSVRCPHCGFDPVLYKANPDEAAAKVKAFLENRKNDPKFLLKPRPQIEPIVKKTDNWRDQLLPAKREEQTEPFQVDSEI